MKKSDKTRNQLLLTVTFLTSLSVIVAAICFMLFKRIHEIYRVSGSMHKIYEHYSIASNCEENFLFKETEDPEFMGSEESFSTKNFHTHLKALHLQLDELNHRQAFNDFHIEQEIEKLTSEISKYETLFSFALHKADVEGIDNLGTSMQLRRNEFELEQKSELIGLSNVLSLQKIEKDYLLNKDASYIRELEAKVESINVNISNNTIFDFKEKIALIKLLHDFRYSFLELVRTNNTIGFKNEQKLTDHIFQSKEIINRQFVLIDKKIAKKELMLTNNIENALLIFILNVVTLTIFILYLYTRKKKDLVEEVVDSSEKMEKVFEMRNSA